jgi:hypothetical protein
MKGVISLAVKEMIVKKYGEKTWGDVIKKAGLDREPVVFAISDVDDKLLMQIIGAAINVLNIDMV